MLVFMGFFGGICMLASVIFGIIIQQSLGEETVGDFSNVRTIPLEIAAYAIEPWNIKSCNMVLGDELLVIFVLRRYVFEWMANRFYGHLPENKRAKIANYMLELLVMNTAIGITAWCGFFNLLINPSSFHHPTQEQGDRLFIGAQQVVNLYISTYVLQMCFDRAVRPGLVMHHWAAFLLCIWGTSALYCLGYDVLMTRAFFCLFLYVLTEQNVFFEMLLYQAHIYMPRLFYASAWYYLLTRIFIAAYVIICWLDMFEEVFENHNHNNWVGYSMWAAIPVINLILNVTQWTTVSSLFGIAKSVEKRCREVDVPTPSVTAVQSSSSLKTVQSSSSMKKVQSSSSLKKMQSTRTDSTSATMTTVTSISSMSSACLAPVEEQELQVVSCDSCPGLLDVFADIDYKERGAITSSEWMQFLGSAWSDDDSIPLRVYEGIFDEMRALCGEGPGVTVDAFVAYFNTYDIGDQADFDLTLSTLALQRAHELADGDLAQQDILRQKHRAAVRALLRHRREQGGAGTAADQAATREGEAPPLADMCVSGDDEEESDDSNPAVRHMSLKALQ